MRMKKMKEFFDKNKLKKWLRLTGVLVYTLVVILLTYAVVNTFFMPEAVEVVSTEIDDVKVDVKVLEKTLQENAQLSTAKLKFKAEAEYDGEGIPGITQNQFTVLCEATVKAGIDMNDVKIEVNDDEKIVKINVPIVEIKPEDVYINHESLKFYDKKFVLFPVDVQEDTAKALALAENIAKNYAHNMGIIEMANKQGGEIIKGILSNAIPRGYKIEVIKE